MQYITNMNQKTLEIGLIGRFTFNDNDNFRTILNTMGKPDIDYIVFKLEHTDFIDSAALGMFLIAKEESEKLGRNLQLNRPRGYVKKIFEISKFYSIFDVKD